MPPLLPLFAHRLAHALQQQICRLPSRCLLCSAQSCGLLCAHCADELPVNLGACPRCALPQCQFTECPNCQKHPPAFAKAVAPYSYQAPLAGLINRWKHRGDQRLLPFLAPQLLGYLRAAYAHDDWPQRLVPVPVSTAKRMQRGFNQTEQLARCLGGALGIGATATLLGRRQGQSQQGLGRRARLKNLQQQFYITGPAPAAHLALVDDVMTTGATAATLAKILQDAGAKRVDIWMIARTP
ncbi:ComF family protein [Simiduia sp. 21SJ11W-1]|uniref:ComF family protein n=1 Tax=Simiduia sp. 21SJ11W-1 TaxID=2909669 RepID=UPI0020A06D9F|nr:ComF family protein [Simiduia sp. 21SJ11W-1]UTA47546.1 ComF family protein [Simiduia sp. 21SJ11W-1]